MKKMLVGVIIVFATFLIGCEGPTNEEVYYEIQKNFNSIDIYQCLVDIKINESEKSQTYKAEHTYKHENQYKIKMLSPDDSAGIITVYNGKQAWLYHPQINQKKHIKEFKESSSKNVFLATFLENSLTSEYIDLSSEVIDNKEYIIITVEIPGNNKYRKTSKLWVGKDNLLPFKMNILDNNIF